MRLTVASIGPITTRTAEERGVRVDVTAKTYTVDGLLDALERHFETRCRRLRLTIPPQSTLLTKFGD